MNSTCADVTPAYHCELNKSEAYRAAKALALLVLVDENLNVDVL